MDYARCNFDGKPIHPDDKQALATFRIFLQMDDDEKREAVRLDREWQKWVYGSVEEYERIRAELTGGSLWDSA